MAATGVEKKSFGQQVGGGHIPVKSHKYMQKKQWQLLHVGAYLDWPAKYVPFLVKKADQETKPGLQGNKWTENSKPKTDSVNTRDKQRRSSLHIAAKEDNYRFIRGLTEVKNLDVNAQDSKGFTPLHYAAQEGHVRVASALIYHRANANVQSSDGARTPLHVALANGHFEVAKLLYYHGRADITMKTKKQRNCLHFAAQFSNSYEFVQTLLQSKKFQVNDQDKYGNTALHYAVKCGSLEMVKLLTDNGANQKLKNTANMTPLHLSIYSGYFAIVEHLVKNGASPKSLTGILVSILTSKDKAFYADVITYIRCCLDNFLCFNKMIKDK